MIKQELNDKLIKHLKDNNCLATPEDCANYEKQKYFILYDYMDNTIHISFNWCTRPQGTIFSTNEKILLEFLNKYENEIKKFYFDINN